MAFHPQVEAVLAAQAALGLPDLRTLPPAQARVEAAARRAAAGLYKEPVAQVEEQTIRGPGGDLPIRIYTPEGAALRPLLMIFHGGGWVYGNPESEDCSARVLVNRTGATAVSVDYRLAPEHPFPAAPEDCYAATEWAVANASSLGADPSRLAVAGTSAGGNLSAVVCLMSRDRKGPSIVHQVLFNPVVDCRLDTPSYLDNAQGCGMTRSDMSWFWDHYLANPEERTHPYASPLRAEKLEDLPPATIITAEFDVLRDEAETFAERLRAAGVDVQCTRYDGMVHAFNNQLGIYDLAADALEEAAARLQLAF